MRQRSDNCFPIKAEKGFSERDGRKRVELASLQSPVRVDYSNNQRPLETCFRIPLSALFLIERFCHEPRSACAETASGIAANH